MEIRNIAGVRARQIVCCALGGSVVALAASSASPVRLRNVAQSAGIRFVLQNHPTQEKHLIETMAGGVAAFDFDGDGLTDIYFTNGASIPTLAKDSPMYWNRLYRNEGEWTFRDVTGDAGVAGEGYSIGASAADYDNDGDADLFVTGVRHNILYRNQGGGKFQDITRAAGIQSDRWSVGAAWFDYDNDGLLDLLVVNYVDWTPEFNVYCGSQAENIRAYCHPRLFDGSANTLYRNSGDGSFQDVSAATGIANYIGKGMAAAVADYDSDGFPDIFVTNDKQANFLFHNLGGEKFEEIALLAGGALRDDGLPLSGMGVDFRDYDNDGQPDVVFTALSGETFPLFRNEGAGRLTDATLSSGLAPLTQKLSGWSVGLYDFDNDGWKDIFTANSHVSDVIEHFEAARYKMTNSVFLNQGNGTFGEVSKEAGLDGAPASAHRGAAFADFDNDGKVDVAVSSLGGPAELWKNVSEAANHWLTLRLVGTTSNRNGIGGRIRVARQVNQMTTAVGYASSSLAGVHFGLGRIDKLAEIEILWPGGAKQVLRGVGADQILEVREP